MITKSIEWRRRTGGQHVAHALRDGVVLCWVGRFPADAANAYQGHVATALVPADLAPSGVPYGAVCDLCLSRLQRKGAA